MKEELMMPQKNKLQVPNEGKKVDVTAYTRRGRTATALEVKKEDKERQLIEKDLSCPDVGLNLPRDSEQVSYLISLSLFCSSVRWEFCDQIIHFKCFPWYPISSSV